MDIYETCVHIVEQTVIKKPEKKISILIFMVVLIFFIFNFKKKIKIEINIETEKQTANRIWNLNILHIPTHLYRNKTM